MRSRIGFSAAGLLAAIALVAAPSASAATEFGDNCDANDLIESSVTIFEIASSGNPLPTSAPSAGVITKWKVNVIPTPLSFPQTLKVLRQTGPNTVQVVGEASQNVTGGPNTFEARIPVQAGDRLGLFNGDGFGPLNCEATGLSLIGAFEGGGSIGASSVFAEVPAEIRVPVSAVIEPDADNDGFGDETQDKCPQSAAFQGDCPIIAIDTASVIKRKGSVTVLLTASSATPVTVAGTVNLGKGKKAKLKGVTKAVTPGKISRFMLKFPKGLKNKLKGLAPKKSLRLKVTASATDLIGRVSTDTLKTKLKGQAKAK